MLYVVVLKYTSFIVLTILFYHLGCLMVYLLKFWDGARVVPVHGVWLVNPVYSTLYSQYCFSGFWGVMCVGIFSKDCLIREIYETSCFCEELSLPERVSN